MNDRKLGYLIIVLLVLLLGATIGYGTYVLLFPRQTRVIEFNLVGNIGIEDPVCFRGVSIGLVRRLEGVGDRIYATVEFFKPVNVYADYEIITMDKGLMGDRIITFSPGDSSHPLVPASDTLHGSFFIGVSEVLGMVGVLEDGVKNFILQARLFLDGSETSPGFVEQFTDASRTLDSISLRLKMATAAANRSLAGQLNELNAALSATRKITGKISTQAAPALVSVENSVVKMADFANRIEKTVSVLDSVVTKLEKSDLIVAGQAPFELSRKLRELRDLINDIEQGNARLKLRISRLKE